MIVYDSDVNTWQQVVGILQKATACTQEEAEIETWEIDNLGKSVVHHGGQEECNSAGDSLAAFLASFPPVPQPLAEKSGRSCRQSLHTRGFALILPQVEAILLALEPGRMEKR